MDSNTAFAAVALSAVAWDGFLSREGSRALRHSLDYRPPFNAMGQEEMVKLFDRLLKALREAGPAALLVRASSALNGEERKAAFAVANELMRSDGPLVQAERKLLDDLQHQLELRDHEVEEILRVMDVLHHPLTAAS
ncbi:MAG: Tellurite resistance protein TerB [Aphanocapsa feldmannii 277cV]|uniref:Tellurite resistance protein TerB n=2 Tax=Aphanocapsa feldmannii TaxID=192050 RepID=A0A524RQ08_9CHRO|nr:MAG: Tellurite resistance protein TerB [Aphanocapsa feldmannii 277cV]TGH24557.1 MAG: Tellurite resistance protein TerB [Aphanocapsa feldmannii 277cI]